jgi:mannonate dehydratase
MKLGLGLKPHLWNDAYLKFARQLGCESVVAWVPLPEGDGIWHTEDLKLLKQQASRHGLELVAIENFHPAHWDHIVLGEDDREEQMAKVGQTIRNVGEAGIPCLGYNFSACGVQGYYTEKGNTDGRGKSSIKRFDIAQVVREPLPNREFWFNTLIERRPCQGFIPTAGEEDVWSRLHWFLERALPIAEAAGVKLCAHPDDPPVSSLRGIYRALHDIAGLRKLVNMFDSPSNCLEFCQGTISTMEGVDIYETIREFASRDKIGYVHFRNTSGMLPRYSEVFIDEGYVNMPKALELYRANGFTGTFIPDHTPGITSTAPWDAGMAFALGYLRGLIQSDVEKPKEIKWDY